MKILFAQGNPGNEYINTRHNVGFLALDYFASTHNLGFQAKSKFFADIAEGTVSGERVLLVKPTTYYNESGKAARAIADFYKVDTPNILVIHDELSLPFGTLRVREKGSDAGNNGIKSLNAHIGENYSRLRVGTQNDLLEKISSHDFVLSRFSAEENDKLQKDIFPKISEIIENFCAGTQEVTSHTV